MFFFGLFGFNNIFTLPEALGSAWLVDSREARQPEPPPRVNNGMDFRALKC